VTQDSFAAFSARWVAARQTPTSGLRRLTGDMTNGFRGGPWRAVGRAGWHPRGPVGLKAPSQNLAASHHTTSGRSCRMTPKSRQSSYCPSIRAATERANEARNEADRLAVEAWNKRMLGFCGPAQPSPTLGHALNAGYPYLEMRCLGCDTHQTVALDVIRRPKATPIHELERYMRCKDRSQVRGYAYKRSHLVALRQRKISASDPPSTWWPGER
jgi:hypothetical protein